MSRILNGNRLWKTVENRSVSLPPMAAGQERSAPMFSAGPEDPQQTLRTCSACAGDYEDPDRTAWTLDVEDEDEALQAAAGEDEGVNDAETCRDEFPAQET